MLENSIGKIKEQINVLQNKFASLHHLCQVKSADEYDEKINIRQFYGTVNLEYVCDDDTGKTANWTIQDVQQKVSEWIEQSAKNNKPLLNVKISNEETQISWKDGTLHKESFVKIYGELTEPNNITISDSKIKKTLTELFIWLRVELKQQSLRFNFQGYNENISVNICKF